METEINLIKEMDMEAKEKMKASLETNPHICQECLKDEYVKATRDVDAICIHCGKKYCGTHMFLHLKRDHKINVADLHYNLEDLFE